MNTELYSFIEEARAKGWDDDKIYQQLTAAGWDANEVNAAIANNSNDGLVVPKPPSSSHAHTTTTTRDESPMLTDKEQGVKAMIFEYHIMFITLWVVAVAAFWAMNALLFGADLSSVTFPATAIIVCLPVLAFFFIRRIGAERQDPTIRRIKDRLNLIHGTQSLAFIIVLIHTIYAVYQLMSGGDSMAQQLVSWFFTIVVFGGIFAYYWQNTHTRSGN